MSRDFSSIILRNSWSNIFRGGISFFVILLLTPYILKTLGDLEYGIWAMVNAFAGYLNFFDLGLSFFLSRYVSEANVKKDYEKMNLYFNTTFVIYLFLGFFSVISIFLLREFILNIFFKVEPTLRQRIDSILLLAVCIFAFNLIFSIYRSALIGLQRMDISNKVIVFTTIVNAVATVFFLQIGWGLEGLILALAISSVLSTILYKFYLRSIMKLKLNPFKARLKEIKNMFKFSLHIQTVSFATLISTHLDKFLLGYFVGLRYVGFYEIGTKIINVLRGIPIALLSPIMPVSAELFAYKDYNAIYNLYYRSQKYLTFVSLPIFLFFVFFSNKIVTLWIGENVSYVAYVIAILMVPNFINVLTGAGFFILGGKGTAELAFKSSILGTILNFFLSFFLVVNYGYKGVVWGTAIALVISGIYFIIVSHRSMGISLKNTFGKVVLKPVIVIISLLFLEVQFLTSFKIQDNLYFFIGSVGYFLGYFLLLYFLAYFDSYDWSLVKKFRI